MLLREKLRLTDTSSWTMQCRISMYWYSSQQLSTVVSSGFLWFCHPAEGRPALSQPGPLSFHHERCEDTPRESISLSCRGRRRQRRCEGSFSALRFFNIYLLLSGSVLVRCINTLKLLNEA